MFYLSLQAPTEGCNEMTAGQISTKLMSDTLKITVFIVFTVARQHLINLSEILPAIILGTCAPPVTKEIMLNRCC